jgi:hypothetical protein
MFLRPRCLLSLSFAAVVWTGAATAAEPMVKEVEANEVIIPYADEGQVSLLSSCMVRSATFALGSRSRPRSPTSTTLLPQPSDTSAPRGGRTKARSSASTLMQTTWPRSSECLMSGRYTWSDGPTARTWPLPQRWQTLTWSKA